MSGNEPAQGRENAVNDVVMDECESEGNRHTPELLWDSLAEAYADGRCGLHVHFRASFVKAGIAGDWCAAFNQAEDRFDVVNGQVVGHEKGHAQLREKNNMGQTVLVLVRKLVKLPQRTAAELPPSVVRLQTLDDCLRGWRDAPDHVLVFARELGTIAEDRESRLTLDVGRDSPAVMGEGQFVDEVVEGSAEVVDTVPDDEAEFSGWRVEHFKPSELVEVINIEVRPSSVRAFISPGSHFGFKALQVVERPVQPSFVVEGHTTGSMPKDRAEVLPRHAAALKKRGGK
jgi:hypothetical protein